MLYFAPETVLPIASAVAAGLGAVLLFFRRGVTLTKSILDRVLGRNRGAPKQ